MSTIRMADGLPGKAAVPSTSDTGRPMSDRQKGNGGYAFGYTLAEAAVAQPRLDEAATAKTEAIFPVATPDAAALSVGWPAAFAWPDSEQNREIVPDAGLTADAQSLAMLVQALPNLGMINDRSAAESKIEAGTAGATASAKCTLLLKGAGTDFATGTALFVRSAAIETHFAPVRDPGAAAPLPNPVARLSAAPMGAAADAHSAEILYEASLALPRAETSDLAPGGKTAIGMPGGLLVAATPAAQIASATLAQFTADQPLTTAFSDPFARTSALMRVLNLKLEPASLGSVAVRLHLSGVDLSMRIVTADAAAKVTIERQDALLRTILNASGYRVGDIAIASAADGAKAIAASDSSSAAPAGGQPAGSNGEPMPQRQQFREPSAGGAEDRANQRLNPGHIHETSPASRRRAGLFV